MPINDTVQRVTKRSYKSPQLIGERNQTESNPMGLFKPDLFRSLAFGFLMGIAVMAVSTGTTALATPDTAGPAAQHQAR